MPGIVFGTSFLKAQHHNRCTTSQATSCGLECFLGSPDYLLQIQTAYLPLLRRLWCSDGVYSNTQENTADKMHFVLGF